MSQSILAVRSSTPRVRLVIRRAEELFVVLTGFVLALRLFKLISQYAVNVFFVDQWEFNDATLFQRHTLWQMFDWQYGPHRQGVGALFQLLVEPLIRWNSRTESFIAGAVLVVLTACALWLKVRLYGPLRYTDAIIPLVFLNPMQHETLFVVVNFAHGPLPVLLIVLYCVAWTCTNRIVRYGLVLTLNFLTIFTGFGLLLGLLTPVILGADLWVNLRNSKTPRRYAALPLLISVASMASFFIGYRSLPAADCFTYQLQPIGKYFEFMIFMFSPFFGVPGIGAVAALVGMVTVCGLMVALMVSARGALRQQSSKWSRDVVIAVLTAYCLLFCVTAAYGRLCMGLQLAQASRYVIYLNLGLLGLYFSLLTISDRVVRNMLLVVFGLSLLGTIASGEQYRKQRDYWYDIKVRWKNCYLATGNLKECNKVSWIYPFAPERTHLQEKLDFLKSTRQNLFTDSK